MKKISVVGKHFLAAAVVAVALAASQAARAEGPFDFSSYNQGVASGCVLDAETGKPIFGAAVTLQMAGAKNEEYQAPVYTEVDGCYRLPLPLGLANSKISAKKVMKSSIFSLVTNPKGVTEKSKIIYNSFANLQVMKKGYKTFSGVNQAIFGDPKPFQIYLDGVKLAPESVDYSSFLAGDGGDAGFVIERADLPAYFEADVEKTAEIALKFPSGLAPDFTVEINFSDPYGKLYEGDKYRFVLANVFIGEDGTRIYKGSVTAGKKNFPREFRVIAAITTGDKRMAEKSYPSIMPISDNEKEAAAKFADGMGLLIDEDYAGAVEAFRQAIAINNTYKCFFERLGDALVAQGKLDEAVEHYRNWLEADPKNHNPNVEMAKIFVAQKKYQEAYDILALVGKLDKKDPLAFRRYYEPLHSIVQIETGKPAQIDFQRAITMLVNHTQDADFTLELLKKADETFPEDASISFLYGTAMYNRGDMDEAITRYERAISFDAANEEYKTTLAKLYLQQGQCEKTLNLTEPSADGTKNFYMHHLSGVCNLENGSNDRALANFENAVRYGFDKSLMNREEGEYISTTIYGANPAGGSTTLVFQQDETVRYYSGFSFDEGKYDFGYMVSQASLGEDPSEALSMLQAGIMIYNIGAYETAAKNLEAAIAADDTLVQAYKYLALSRRALGDEAGAEEAMATYRRMNPFDPEGK